MRTTLTLDDDVAARLRAEARATGKAFRQIVNEALRIGLNTTAQSQRSPAFRVVARSLGGLQPGVSLDNVGALLEQVEGALHR